MEPTIRQLSDLERYRQDLIDLDLSTVPGRLVALELVNAMESILGKIKSAEDEAEHLRRMAEMDRSILRIVEYAAQIRRSSGMVAVVPESPYPDGCPVVVMSREEEEAFDDLERQAEEQLRRAGNLQ